MGNALQINRSRNTVRVERTSDLNESDLGEVYCILLSLILKKKPIRINIFITIQYLKYFYLIPLNIRVLVLSVHIPLINRSSYLRSLSPGMSLVALLCIFQAYVCVY